MSEPEANPEQRSNSALLCFCIGAGLIGASWLMGLGGVLTLAVAGNGAALAAGGLMTLLLIPLVAACGAILILVGGIWMIVRVVADSQAGDKYSKTVQR
jgi:membrane protein implicated in regulation of membrane protease activity